jgi:hypothetical protein
MEINTIRFGESAELLAKKRRPYGGQSKKNSKNANALPLAGEPALSLTAVSRASTTGAAQTPGVQFFA